jgi:hypothetical protein
MWPSPVADFKDLKVFKVLKVGYCRRQNHFVVYCALNLKLLTSLPSFFGWAWSYNGHRRHRVQVQSRGW